MNLPAPYAHPYRHRCARAVLGVVIFAPLTMFAAPPAQSAVIHNVSANGMKVFGYVDTDYLGTTGQRTRLGSSDSSDWMSQIERDVATWYAFYGSDLTGIFFDQAQNACGPVTEPPPPYE